jgi:nucleoside-diphosphate-sugar epimerase
MNILITGASGFIGEHFLRLINREKIFADENIVLLSSRKISGYSCILHNNYTFSKDDFIEAGIDHVDIVFHLGSSVPKNSREYGIEYAYKYIMNIRNTIHLFENLPNIPQKFIFISSTDIYGFDRKDYTIDENSPLSFENMYGASKVMCEKYLEEKANSNNFVLQILRLSPIYGPGEDKVYSKIVSTFIKQIISGQQVNVFSDGSDVRSMLFVEDCCRSILEASYLNEYIGPVNIASSQSITVKMLAELVCSICGAKPNIKYGTGNTTHRNIFDNSKMKHYFNLPETNIKDGLIVCCNYYGKGIYK